MLSIFFLHAANFPVTANRKRVSPTDRINSRERVEAIIKKRGVLVAEGAIVFTHMRRRVFIFLFFYERLSLSKDRQSPWRFCRSFSRAFLS